LNGLAVLADNDAWAVGYYQNGIPNPAQTLIEHWDGLTWSIQPSLNPGTDNHLTGISALAANDIWAVGDTYNGTTQTLIVHWNGSQWSRVPSPTHGPGYSDLLTGVAALSVGNIWAVGYTIHSGATQTLIEHWDGTQWQIVPSPNPAPLASRLLGVAARA